MKVTTNRENIGRINTIGMFDLSRGLLMLMVLFGHSITLFLKYWELENSSVWAMIPLLVFRVFIYGLIPMFFIMSGYGFREQKMKRCITDRVRYLLKPYLLVAVIVTGIAVLKALLQGNSVLSALQYQGFPFLIGLCPGETQVFGWYTASIGPMWFLVTLGVAWIFLNLLFRIKSVGVRIVCLIAVITACTQLPFQALIPFCIIQSVCCAGYLYIGYCVKKTQLLTQKLSGQTLVILLLILLCVLPFGNVEVSQNVWKLGFLDYVASAVMGVLLCFGAVFLERFEGAAAKLLRLIGKNSLYILCVHTVEYLVFPWKRLVELLSDHVFFGIVAALISRMLLVGLGCFVVNKAVKLLRSGKRR